MTENNTLFGNSRHVLGRVERAQSFSPPQEDINELQTVGNEYIVALSARSSLAQGLRDEFDKMADQIEGIDPNFEERIKDTSV